ncbi:MAG: hypothetical protein QW516_06050 [Nitrososphaerota archaeon]
MPKKAVLTNSKLGYSTLRSGLMTNRRSSGGYRNLFGESGPFLNLPPLLATR